ncbi:Cytochrome c oxidase subunit 5A [Carabus blaptoides fortunei]
MKEPKDHGETDDEYDERMECFFTRPEIDGWELRMALNEMAGMDAVPDPKVLIAALCACRRVNDFAMTVRILEMVKFKCGPQAKVIYPWILKNIETVMEELGIDTPERLGTSGDGWALVLRPNEPIVHHFREKRTQNGQLSLGSPCGHWSNTNICVCVYCFIHWSHIIDDRS